MRSGVVSNQEFQVLPYSGRQLDAKPGTPSGVAGFFPATACAWAAQARALLPPEVDLPHVWRSVESVRIWNRS